MIELELVPPSTHRLRFGVSPLEEAMGAVRVMLGLRGHPAYRPWLESVTGIALPIDELRMVLSGRTYITDFLSPPPEGPETTAEAQLAEIRRTPPAQVAAELAMVDADLSGLPEEPARARDLLADQMSLVWTELVAPYWPRIRATLVEDIAYRSRRLAEGGIGLVLRDLHPSVRLAGDMLVVQTRGRARGRLDRRGLLLLPCVFAWPRVGLMLVPPWQPSLLYPARAVARLWAGEPVPDGRLTAAFGRTKAALLLALAEPASTSALAVRLGLAASTVSGHLTALRDVGLLTAGRAGHEVRYRLSDLGESLLAGLA